MARISRDIYRYKMSRDLEITIPLRPHPPPPRFQTNPSAKLIFAIPSKIYKIRVARHFDVVDIIVTNLYSRRVELSFLS